MPFMNSFVRANFALSDWIDGFLPPSIRKDGNRQFRTLYSPRALQPNSTIYDLGGGSQPAVTLDEKTRFGLTVVGLDISGEELDKAAPGIYDRKIEADLCTYIGNGDADIVICQATLEHVPDGVGAMRAISTILKPGGTAYIFAPCRYAVFARVNLLLPQKLKERLLFSLIPSKATGHDGFPAFYDNCTPKEVESTASKYGLIVDERSLFWTSSYFKVFLPAYVAWRVAQGILYLFIRENAAETYIYVLKKPANP